MRIAIVCPHYPPRNCGVGDYTAQLAREFIRQEHVAAVWTAEPKALSDSGVAITTIPFPWGLSTLREITRGILGFRADAVFVQYTPQLYGPKYWGVNPVVPIWVEELRRRTKSPVIVNVHEVNYPVELSARGIAIGLPHVAQFFGIAQFADKLVFTYERSFNKASKRIFWRRSRFSWAPVGSNIEVYSSPGLKGEISTMRHSVGISEHSRVWVHFGGAHPTHMYAEMFEALNVVKSTLGEDVVLVCVGLEKARLEDLIKSTIAPVPEKNIRALGYLSANDVSKWLQTSELVLSPFTDGISTRRGSAMAAFQHGKLVVTTRGVCTNETVPWDDFCVISNVGRTEAFVRSLLEVVGQRNRMKELASRGKQYYDANFSWPVIAKTMVGLL